MFLSLKFGVGDKNRKALNADFFGLGDIYDPRGVLESKELNKCEVSEGLVVLAVLLYSNVLHMRVLGEYLEKLKKERMRKFLTAVSSHSRITLPLTIKLVVGISSIEAALGALIFC